MNYFIEGLQGSCKSTLVGRLSEKLPGYKVYREGDLIAHFRYRQNLELRLCREIFSEESVIVRSKQYDINDLL